MKAIKMKSGRWRVSVYDYTDPEGRQHNKTFTGDTKKEALQKASNYSGTAPVVMTVAQAVGKYIETREPVLSPSTVASYRGILRTHLTGAFGGKNAAKLSKQDFQAWISALAKTHSGKTVANCHGLVTATLKHFYGAAPQVRLPQKKKPRLYAPTDEDICRVLNASASDPELQRCIMLGAFCGLRRGEICALSADDVDGDQLIIDKAIARGPDGYVQKPPKTDDSNRVVDLPQSVLDRLPKEGPFVESSPNAITARFLRLVESIGLPHFRFHDLRHYFATRLAYIGVPSRIICDMGGWRTDKMMKRVYLDVAQDELLKQKKRAAEYFDNLKPTHNLRTTDAQALKKA